MPPTENCIQGATNQKKIDQLRIDFDRSCEETDKHFADIGNAIKEIREKLLGRPSWWVVLVITSLIGATCTLATYIIMAG